MAGLNVRAKCRSEKAGHKWAITIIMQIFGGCLQARAKLGEEKIGGSLEQTRGTWWNLGEQTRGTSVEPQKDGFLAAANNSAPFLF